VSAGIVGADLGVTAFATGAAAAPRASLASGVDGWVASGVIFCVAAGGSDFDVGSSESESSPGGELASVAFAAPGTAGIAELPGAGSVAPGWTASPVAGAVSGGAGFAVGCTGTTGAAAPAESGAGSAAGVGCTELADVEPGEAALIEGFCI
jgi:hypothetical protein